MVRIVPWLKPDPLAILRSGKVICLVNHGGANSCLEAISTGIPQLVLPGWYDSWDWAARVDYLGIGVWGNRHAGLFLNGEEVSRGFLRVCEEPKAGEQESSQTTSKESKGSAAQRSNILRVNVQRLVLRAGTPGSRKAMGMILERAEATREKHSRASAQQANL
jgi:UDP-glucoronosyl and UDP-glucosyl transferase